MPVDSVTAGGNTRLVQAIGDNSVASSVLSVGQVQNQDANSVAALYSLLASVAPVVFNGSTWDRLRAAVGGAYPGLLAAVTEGQKSTYSVAYSALTPYATPTDFWQLVGSSTKTVRLLFLKVTGVATGAAAVDTFLIKRTAANTGGTVVADTIAQHDSNDAAPTAVSNHYTAIPSGLGAGANIRAEKLFLGATPAPAGSGYMQLDFTQHNDKAPVLRGVAQSLALNWNGVAVPAGTLLSIEAMWSEE